MIGVISAEPVDSTRFTQIFLTFDKKVREREKDAYGFVLLVHNTEPAQLKCIAQALNEVNNKHNLVYIEKFKVRRTSK